MYTEGNTSTRLNVTLLKEHSAHACNTVQPRKPAMQKQQQQRKRKEMGISKSQNAVLAESQLANPIQKPRVIVVSSFHAMQCNPNSAFPLPSPHNQNNIFIPPSSLREQLIKRILQPRRLRRPIVIVLELRLPKQLGIPLHAPWHRRTCQIIPRIRAAVIHHLLEEVLLTLRQGGGPDAGLPWVLSNRRFRGCWDSVPEGVRVRFREEGDGRFGGWCSWRPGEDRGDDFGAPRVEASDCRSPVHAIVVVFCGPSYVRCALVCRKCTNGGRGERR